MRLTVAGDGATVTATAWGPGAEAALAAAPGLAGAEDDDSGFEPAHRLVRELRRRLRGLRLARTGAVVEVLVPSVLEQRVTGPAARRSFAAMVRAHGEPAPGPAGDAGMVVPPAPTTWSAVPPATWHRSGVERRRAETVRRACLSATALERLAGVPPAEAAAVLRSVPGIGPWTAAEVVGRALGDPDAVPVGDLHLPHQAAWALAGEPRGSDERMLELLAPFAGHRGAPPDRGGRDHGSPVRAQGPRPPDRRPLRPGPARPARPLSTGDPQRSPSSSAQGRFRTVGSCGST